MHVAGCRGGGDMVAYGRDEDVIVKAEAEAKVRMPKSTELVTYVCYHQIEHSPR